MDEYSRKSASRKALASRTTMKALISRLPKYLINRDTHQSLKAAINENKMIDDFLLKSDIQISTAFNELQKNINDLITSSKINYNYCITGSRAWYELFESIFSNLSEYEQSSIYKYNTCDSIYLLETSRFTSLDSKIKELINEFVEYLKVILQPPPGKYFSIELKPIDKTKYLFREATGYNIDLKFSDTPIISVVPDLSSFSVVPMPKSAKPLASVTASSAKSRTTKDKKAEAEKKKEAEKKAKEALEKAKEAAKSARAQRASSRRKDGGSPKPDNFYRIFTFEFNLCNTAEQKKLLNNFNNLVTPTSHYLNAYGLYIFNTIAKNRFFIKRGSYNRFKVRDGIFNKLVLTPDVKSKALSDILNIYELTFKDVRLPNQYTIGLFEKQVYLSYQDIENFVTKVETQIIECLRPYINQTIININNDLKQLTFKDNYGQNKLGKDLTGIFVAGGDAIRRYDYNASVTKDIDTKIYLSTEIPMENFDNQKILDDCIINNLFILLVFLIKNVKEIFKDINNSVNLKTTSSNGIDVEFSLISSNPNILNFKLRKLFKGAFPVDLYSLDYKAKVMFENNPARTYDYEIAFLDIAYEQLTENYYKKYAVVSNGLPISRMKFLLDDLKKTYNSDLSSMLRFQAGKIVKDYKRYEDLYKIYVNSEQLTQESAYYIRKASDEYVINYTDPAQQRANLNLDKSTYINKSAIEREELYDIYKQEYDKRNATNKEKVLFNYELPKTMKKGGAFQFLNPKVIELYNQYKNNNDYRQLSETEADNIQNYLDRIIRQPSQSLTSSSRRLPKIKNFIKSFNIKQ
jgi:hypothetical protein